MTERPTDKRDPRDVPNYTLAESARWLGLVPATMRVWLVGQNYTTKSGTKRMHPIVRPARAEGLGISFWNLVECSVVASIRNTHKVSFQKVRRALDYVQKLMDMSRPLSRSSRPTASTCSSNASASSSPPRRTARPPCARSWRQVSRGSNATAEASPRACSRGVTAPTSPWSYPWTRGCRLADPCWPTPASPSKYCLAGSGQVTRSNIWPATTASPRIASRSS